jgi:hypothetical protein
MDPTGLLPRRTAASCSIWMLIESKRFGYQTAKVDCYQCRSSRGPTADTVPAPVDEAG